MTLVSAIQMTSTPNLTSNLTAASHLIATAANKGAQLVVLPEMFPMMGAEEMTKLALQEEFGNGVIQDFLASRAKQHKIWLVGGTIPIKTHNPNKVSAACIVYNDQGHIAARYDKIHLFDVTITSGVETYCESQTFDPGHEIVVIDTPFGKLGLAVCYDLRFPELFRCLVNKGAQIVAVPCAFTVKTGQDHWEALTRCRAIESLNYFIFACQTGQHSPQKHATYGHSRIVDPWGKVLSQIDEESGVITANVDLQLQKNIREKFPALTHQRIAVQCDSIN
ncbi:MAG TPA: carbon-nitrogen hydrolase family protein [Gammaproteobacteria bacterium]|nr:carbon-nitrogen hydrolase family protein [Gammaproteobacteria bacterium]